MERKNIVIILVLLVVINIALAATRVYYVEETDFIKIDVDAVDPDNDNVAYTYSVPLDEKGEWQTDYDDAGEYDVDITASDGQGQTVERVKIIVTNKNQPPKVTENKIIVKETQQVDLKLAVKDPDDDPLSYVFKAPFDKNGRWQTTYGNEGTHIASFTVSDGEFNTTARVEVVVVKTNQPPIIATVFSEDSEVHLNEGETLTFFANAVDKDNKDNGSVTYSWLLDTVEITREKEGSYSWSYESAGKHELKLTVADGRAAATKEWVLFVQKTNRKPVLSHPPVTVKEGERVKLNFSQVDLDGDILTYQFELPLDKNGEWQTTYDDAGSYELTVSAFDGNTSSGTAVAITVINVDLAPLVQLPPKLEVKEGNKLVWKINASDPDGDELVLAVKGAPTGSLLYQKNKTFIWEPSYDAIRRKGDFFSDILSALRVEKFILQKKNIPLTVEACGKGLCSFNKTNLFVYNVNRKPLLYPILDINATETDIISLQGNATDPDGDVVRYYFSLPFGRRNGVWKTGYDTAGEHLIYVLATDGDLSQRVPVKVTVAEKNRPPLLLIANDDFTVNENQQFALKIQALDADNDTISISLNNLPLGASFTDGVLRWKPSYSSVRNTSNTSSWFKRMIGSNEFLNKKLNREKTVQFLEFAASDKEYDVIHPVKVTIKNVNQLPEIVDYFPAAEYTARLHEPVMFHVAAKDNDDDELQFKWKFSVHEETVQGTDTIERTFVTPGVKRVTVIVDDGRAAVEKEWMINVLNEEFSPLVSDQPAHFSTKIYVVEG